MLSATPSVDTLSASVNTEQENDTLSVNDENILSAAADSNLLGSDDDGSFTELEKLISSSDKELTLNKNYVFQDSDNPVNIRNNNLVIDFKDNAINASNHQGNILTISGNNITLKNLKISNINGLDNNYGIIVSGNDVLLENIKLYDSKSYIIQWTGEKGTLTKADITNINGFLLLQASGDNFKVTHDGNLSAKGANISGTLTAGTGSQIGNWWIGNFKEEAYDGIEFNGCLIGKTGLNSNKDQIRLYPTVGAIGFTDNANEESGFVYLQGYGNKNTIYIRSTLDPNKKDLFGDLFCKDINCHNIDCKNISTDAKEINILNSLIDVHRIDADNNKFIFLNLGTKGDPTEPVGTVILCAGGIYKCELKGDKKEWVKKLDFE